MSEPFLSLQGVAVWRGGRQVLQVDELAVERGELVLLCGENGSGKSTLILAAAGLLDLAAGKVNLLGRSFHQGVAPAPLKLRRNLALVQQTPYLFATSVLRNTTYGLRLRGQSRPERRRRARKLLERLGISHLAERRADRLSVGEQKLVALARALVLDCPGLLLDEVTASLDEVVRERVLELLRQLVESEGKSILMASHLERASSKLPARRVAISAGRLCRPGADA